MLILSLAGSRQMKLGWEHADDRVDDVVESEGLAQDVSLPTEMALEKDIGQDRDVALRWIGRGRIKARAERGLYPEESENIRGSARAFDPFWLGPAGQVEIRVFE